MVNVSTMTHIKILRASGVPFSLVETGALSSSAKRDTRFSEDWQVAGFCQGGPAFFLPFSSLVAAF